MPSFSHPYIFLLIISSVISAILAISTFKFRPTMGTRSFAILNSAVALWALVSLFEVSSMDPLTKAFSYDLKYLFVAITPVAWLSFGLYYSNRLRFLPSKCLLSLLIIPGITIVMVATNGYHHLMFTTTQWLETGRLLLLQRDFGPWFWVHTVYSYLLLFLGFLFLAKTAIGSPSLYKSQVWSLLVGVLTPWMCNMTYIFDFFHMPRLDFTPFAFTISGIAFMWGIMRHRLLDIAPVARDVVVQNMKDATIVVDTNNRIVDLNSAATRILEKKQDALIGQSAEEMIPWWSSVITNNQLSGSDGIQPTFERSIDGHLLLFQVIKSPLVIHQRLMGYHLMIHDVTAIKKAEDAMRSSEARFRSLAENAPVIIFALDNHGNVTYANPALTKILGYRHDEVMYKPLYDFLVEEEKTRPHMDRFRQLIRGKINVAEMNLLFLHKDGGKRLFNTNASVDTDLVGRITGIVGMAKDVTEEKALQHQFFQSQKMEAIGTLAGGIAHDFNNLLMGMQANISLIRLEPEINPPLNRKLNRIEDQIQSGASLTRQLLGYARKGKYVVTTVNFHQLIEETLNVVQRTNKKIVTEMDLTREMVNIEADRSQMELVLLNLFVNAVDAMPNGGKLSVSTVIVNDKSANQNWTDIKSGTYIETKVMDTGIGMAQATMDRIFEPFFTTKEMGQGTGLGLASVYGVVQNHDGHIRVESQLGKGTTFYLLFPLSDSIIEQAPTKEKTIPLPPGDHRILIVDDEENVLDFCSDMVISLGFSVTKACSGEEAIRLFEQQKDSIDLVILDMIMPEMDGFQTYTALKAINNDINVIISTGYTLDEYAEKALSEGAQYLRKPYTRDELAFTIASAMALKKPKAS